MCWQITHDESRVETQHAEEFASLCLADLLNSLVVMFKMQVGKPGP